MSVFLSEHTSIDNGESDRQFALTINADEAAAGGVKSIQFIELDADVAARIEELEGELEQVKRNAQHYMRVLDKRENFFQELQEAKARIAELERQLADARRTSEYWKAERSALIADTERAEAEAAEANKTNAALCEQIGIMTRANIANHKRFATLRAALEQVEKYLASEESPLHHLWESGDICAYDDNPCDTWEQALLELRNFSIDPAILGYGTEWEVVKLYRAVQAALTPAPIGEGGGE